MFETAYRQRLDTDLATWQRDGIITPSVGEAIRAKLGPVPQGVNIPTVVAIVGALLIAAAFLAFVAANWTAIARPARFVVLLAGIAISYALAAWFDRDGRKYLADVCATVGCIVFGAAIALTGQMYHLSGDFSAGVMLWAGGALLAAFLTGSRGALAVALAVGCLWSGMRMFDAAEVPHLPFIVFWLIGAGLAVTWNAPSARHLVAVAGVAWWAMIAISHTSIFRLEPLTIGIAGSTFMFGLGLALASYGPENSRSLGKTLSSYAVLFFVVIVALIILISEPKDPTRAWVIPIAVAGLLLAVLAAAAGRSVGALIAAVAIAIGLAVATGLAGPMKAQNDPWLGYALSLIAMLCLVVSGMLDNVRPRVVAGWIGLAVVIALITWSLRGSLINRAVFLAVAGLVAVGVANAIGRLMPKESKA